MLQTNFQASKPSNSEEEDFLIFSMYFYDLNLGPPGTGPSRTLGPSLERKGPQGNAIYKILSILAKQF